MINPKELRLGNYVEGIHDPPKTNTIFKIIDAETDLTTIEKFPFNYNPIPLTAEWLERFGFTHYEEFIYKINEDFKISIYGPVYYEGVDNVLNVIANVKYVHSLQNLYFALTGEELTLKG